jgi:hypothetical protein
VCVRWDRIIESKKVIWQPLTLIAFQLIVKAAAAAAAAAAAGAAAAAAARLLVTTTDLAGWWLQPDAIGNKHHKLRWFKGISAYNVSCPTASTAPRRRRRCEKRKGKSLANRTSAIFLGRKEGSVQFRLPAAVASEMAAAAADEISSL